MSLKNQIMSKLEASATIEMETSKQAKDWSNARPQILAKFKSMEAQISKLKEEIEAIKSQPQAPKKSIISKLKI